MISKTLITPEIVDAIHKTPYCKQDGIPNDEKKIIAHFMLIQHIPGDNVIGFTNCHWFVLEDDDFDSPSENYCNNFGKVVFGCVDLGMGLELGSFSIDELSQMKIQNMMVVRNTEIKPLEKTMGEIMKRFNLKWMV